MHCTGNTRPIYMVEAEKNQKLKKKLDMNLGGPNYNINKKIEEKFSRNDLRAVWDGMKAMTGQDKRQNRQINFAGFSENSELANAFNDIYSRFDDEYDFSIAYSNLCDRWGECSLTAQLTITASDVRSVLLKCNTRKSPGPDMITGKLLKVCAYGLCDVFSDIFN